METNFGNLIVNFKFIPPMINIDILASNIHYICILISCNLVFYWRILNYDFISDDLSVYMRKEPEPKNALHRWWLQFRCRRYFNQKEVHLMNIFFHTLNSILIYFLFGSNLLSFCTAMLFLLNPVNSQCSIWASGRSYCISTTFVLLMFLFPVFSPLFYFFTKFFSANAIFSPLTFMTTPYWFWALMPLGLIFFIRKGLIEKSKTNVSNEMKAIGLRKLVTFAKCYGYYFVLCIFPFHLGWHHEYVWGIGVTDKYNKACYSLNKSFWWSLLLVCIVSANLIFNWSPQLWGLLWFSVNIAMWCNFLTWQQQIAERFCYLANVGMMAFLGALLWKLPYPANLILIGMFIAFYATKLWLITPMYKNEYWRIEHTAIDKPKSHYIWLYRGFNKFHNQDFVGALYDFIEARVHSPHEFKVNFNLASTYIVLQNIEEAKKCLKIAEENMYTGEESKLKPMIDKTWEHIKTAEETKIIDMNKVILYS